MDACISYVDTYLCRFWHKNDHVDFGIQNDQLGFGIKTTMCDLHINVNMSYFREQYATNHYSVIWTFYHFCVGHLQSYFLHENLHKYQHNMYMENFI